MGLGRIERMLRVGSAAALLALLAAAAARMAAGARLARADFVMNNGVEVTSLDPATITGQPEGRLAFATLEGLVAKHPRTLAPEPGVAESWECSPDGRRWTFHLRRDARWTNGDPVTAEDFRFGYERLLDPRTAAPYAYLLWCVRGAREFSGAVDASGAPAGSFDDVAIRAGDPWSLEFELEAPTAYFLDVLSFHSLLPVHRGSLESARERWPDRWQVEWLRPENLVTNGPFRVAERRVNDRIRLVKHEGYWDAANVAFDTIDVLAIEHNATILNMYLTGEIHYADRLPLDLIPELLGREDFSPAPFLATYFYRVNVTRPPLDDPRVREALSLGLDRRSLCERVLRAGQSPAYSLVPPGIPGYAPARAHGEDAARARELLAEAGYGPGGRPFPPVEILYNTSEAHRDIALVIADAWQRNLGIRAVLANQEWKVYLDTQADLAYDLARASWIGDYVDPSTFLEVFTSASPNNKTGWSHPEYDRLVRAAAVELEPERRLSLLREAETILVAELPILPLYTYVSQNVVAPRLGGFFSNLADLHPPKHWYWMDDEELAERRRGLPGSILQVASAGPREGKYAPVHRARTAR